MRQRNGEEWGEQHAKVLEHQWEWAKELGVIDEDVDLVAEGS